ncbi:hypothetical protein HYV80_01315, partial [Candidatus Woesearchaeota archaeon]|nr:hypothetical protein [Candidatus Woesearchaeota archaeon]
MKDNLKIKKIALCYLIAVIALFTLISCTTNNNTITGFAVLDENETTTTQSNENQTSTETAAINETDKEKPAKETKEEKPEKQKGPNVPPAWKSDTEEFTLYGETIIDLNNYFYDENNDTITYTSTMPEKISVAIENNLATLAPDGNNFTSKIEFTATDGDKTTKKEVALIVPERAISISLEHNSGTPFDTDDNGYEPTTGIIDLTVEGSKFSWNANESNLCTRWEVYSAENAESTTVCYGSEKCCAFVGLGPSKDIWDEVFYSTYGQYGAGLSNIVSAQIIYVDYGIREETPYAEIYYSPWENKTANYYFASIDFENVCVETCILTGFNETSYKLIFEIDNAVLNLETLTYSIAEDITQVPIILKIEDDAGLNSGAYQLYKNNEPVAVIEEFVEPDYYNIEVVPAENVIDRLLIENANLTHPVSATIGIDNVTREIGIENVEVKKRYAINLEELEFEKATLTANASANALYKCRQWDYGNELCFGAWEKIKDLTAGQQYELALTPDDPGFIEGDLNITLLNITPVNITNITGLALIKEIPNITIAVNQNATIDLADYFSNIDEDTAFANFEQDNISIIFENGIATIVPPKGFIGTSYTYITAAKGADVAISNLFSINVINITPEINLTSNITANITPKVIFRKKDFKFDEDIGVGFEYLTKQELVNEKKWKDEYEVYEEETKKTEVELTLFREKIKEDKKLLSEAEKLTKKQYKKWQKTNDTIEAFIYDNGGDLKDINVEIEELREGRFGVKIPKQRAFKAGKYILKMDLTKDGITYSQEQDFTWGVLAINVNKSIYLPNEDSFIGIGVLDDAGKIVCNADIILEITNPLNQKTTLTTQNNDIKISPECQFLGVTLLPDYYTYYSVGGVGNYIMNLTAVTANGVRNVQDNFTVQSSVAFDVARKSATRVYPKVPYKMEFTVNANDDYSGPIIEYVPSSFAITPQSDIIVNDFGNEKRIIWIEDLKNGKTYNIGYEFDAPDISPEFYILGPLDIGAFKESRQWQIANDVTTRKFFDEFDDTTQWTIAGAGAWTVVSSLVEGTNCGAGADAGTNLSITTSVDLSDCAAGSGLAEWHDIDTQALEATDCLKYTYSSDGGTTWAALATSFCDDQNQLTYKSFTIPDASLTSTFKWRFVCQGVSSTEEVRVNNFNITCDVQDTT